jgi:hypothetical protein
MRKADKFIRLVPVAAGLLWAVFIGLGARMVFTYESAPGISGVPQPKWPSESHLVRAKGKFTLVMLAHPDCPCSRASLAEMEILMAQLRGKAVAFVPFSKPGASAEQLRASDLWKQAAAIPEVSVFFDANGREAEVFGASVSGQTMLYDTEGRLVFSGGITNGRGHQGDNAGIETVVRKVRGEKGQSRVPVFGCSLRDPSARALEEDPSWRKR